MIKTNLIEKLNHLHIYYNKLLDLNIRLLSLNQEIDFNTVIRNRDKFITLIENINKNITEEEYSFIQSLPPSHELIKKLKDILTLAERIILVDKKIENLITTARNKTANEHKKRINAKNLNNVYNKKLPLPPFYINEKK